MAKVKDEELMTKFSEIDNDDNIDMSGMMGNDDDSDGGGGEQDGDKGTEKIIDKDEDGEGKGENEGEDKTGTEKKEDTVALELEAKETGKTVDELREAKKTEEAEVAKEAEKFKTEAEEKGITVDELKLEKEKEAEETEKESIKLEAEETGKTVDEIKKKREEEKEKSDSEFDLFEGFKSEEVNTDIPGEKTDFNYKQTLSDIGIDLDDDKEVKSTEEFISEVQLAINNSKQVLDLEEYPPEVKMIIENYKKNNNLNITDWYRNSTIRQADKFIAKTDEDKVRAAFEIELQNEFSGEDLVEEVDTRIDDMTSEEITTKAKEVNKNIVKLRNREYQKIFDKKNEWLKGQEKIDSKRVDNERKQLKTKIKEMDEFFGFPIPKNVIDIMVKEVDSGVLQKYLDTNPADAKLLAYLGLKLGPRIKEGFKHKLTKSNNDSYNKGTDAVTKLKHNIKKKSAGQQGGGLKSNAFEFDSEYFKE